MWVYPQLAEEMEKEVLQEVYTYVYHLQNKFSQFIATSPIMDLFLVAERRPGSRVANKWCYQDGFCLEGMRKVPQEAEWEEGKENTDGTEK